MSFAFYSSNMRMQDRDDVSSSEISALDFLKSDIDKLYLVTEALWRIIKEKNNLEDEDLAELVSAIDLQDGRLDGRVAPGEPETCSTCGRVLSRRHPACIYCGTPVRYSPFNR
jgi:hypothetical protein